MDCQVSPWAAASSQLREAWGSLEPCIPVPLSPYLTWEFFDSVATVRSNVEVAVLREAGEIVGCFPFERNGARRAIPVAGRLNDLHGPVAESLDDAQFSVILRSAGLTRFDFHAAPIMPWNANGAISRELTGYRALLSDRAGDYVTFLMNTRYSVRQQRRKTRAMEQKLGPVRMEWQTRDDAVLETLLSWKSRQYRRTGNLDVFSVPWTKQLLHRLLRLEPDGMHGQMSALYAGNELMAVHLALRYRNTLYCWFPAYSVEHARFSPGTELFLRMAARAPSEGVTVLDMGCGTDAYKKKLTNETYRVVRGSLDLIPWRCTLRSLGLAARQRASSIPWIKNVHRMVRQAMSGLDPVQY